MNKIPDFTIKGTKLPKLPAGTRYCNPVWNANGDPVWNANGFNNLTLTHNDLYSSGVTERHGMTCILTFIDFTQKKKNCFTVFSSETTYQLVKD